MTTTDAATGGEHVTLADGGEVELWTFEDEDRVTVSAWDTHGNLVGLAWFDAHPSAHPREADIEVTPAARRRGIGAQLLRHLVAAASAHGVPTLTWSQPADDLAVRRLERRSAAIAARRVGAGRVKSTIFVPAA